MENSTDKKTHGGDVYDSSSYVFKGELNEEV
jgi:hypothetical protein